MFDDIKRGDAVEVTINFGKVTANDFYSLLFGSIARLRVNFDATAAVRRNKRLQKPTIKTAHVEDTTSLRESLCKPVPSDKPIGARVARRTPSVFIALFVESIEFVLDQPWPAKAEPASATLVKTPTGERTL
ncbi:MAG: hypothetical protein AMXMBFR76_11530 [Pseudomonadota bacterium]